MIRWFNPLLFLGAALWVWRYNQTHTDRKLMLPFMEALVGPDPVAQGEISWQILLAVGLFFLGMAVSHTIRSRRAPAE